MNPVSVATCSEYAIAPGTVFQSNCVSVGIPVAASAGETSVGAEGTATIVVNVQYPDHGLVPPAFEALTRQKYCVLFESGVERVYVGLVRPVGLTTIDENAASVATWRLYEVAPAAAFQPNRVRSATLEAPFAGDESVGENGDATIVVKLRTADHGLIPAVFAALTRQKYCVLFASGVESVDVGVVIPA